MGVRVVIRANSKVERHTVTTLDEALDLAEREARVLAGGPRRTTVGLRQKSFEPVQQVAGRIEISGHGGLDVRGDGSVEAWTGGWRRRVVEQVRKETPYAALRRALGA